jgi:hypothetical protein
MVVHTAQNDSKNPQMRNPQFETNPNPKSEGPKRMINTDACQSQISSLRISNLFRISRFTVPCRCNQRTEAT